MKTKIYQTNHFSQSQIQHLKESANRQEKKIARVFYHNPDKLFSPSQLHEAEGFSWPLTSTRRALTNLTDADILTKTDKTKIGKYGKPEHCWTWKRPEPVQADMFGRPKPKRKDAFYVN